MRRASPLVVFSCAAVCGCATMKESDTARTGVEQLLVSSAIDRSLDKTDLRPIAGAKVYIEQKYLDCVDKNYVVVGLHQRLMRVGCTIVEKPEDAQVVLEVGSGAVGTDRQSMFVGVPKLSLPGPVPFSTPEIPFYKRERANGTAKIALVAYDTTSKQPVLNTGSQLARSDHKAWNLMGTGHVVSGSVPAEILAATGESESAVQIPSAMAMGGGNTKKK
jgi:hypothetical protein